MKKNNNINNGENLEKEVERIYKLLGAKNTQRRFLIKNYEVDVYATFINGPIEFNVIVECKEYNDTIKVKQEEISNFLLKLHEARLLGLADKGIFITTSDFSKNAISTAKAHGIKCLRLSDLYNQLVNFNSYIEDTAQEFNNSTLKKFYTTQTGSDTEDYENLSELDSTRLLHKPLINYTLKIINTNDEKRIALLGNFGTGKSSFCIKLRDDLLNQHKLNSKNRIPVLIQLKEFRSNLDIQLLITNYLQKQRDVDIDLKKLIELQKMGRFVFILDGLDEMSIKVDRTVINENIREINRLFDEGDNIYIVTCRTHFFQERISEEFLKDYRVLYLTEWSQNDLQEYLQKRYPDNWKMYLNRILSKVSIEELAKTPILLDMIISSLTKIKEDSEINLRQLYENYTNEWIERQSLRKSSIMNNRQRKKFIESISRNMYLSNQLLIHFSDLYEIAKEISGHYDATRIDYFDTDARTSTFIVKDSVGNYGFRHKSFMEYFCSNLILEEIKQNKNHLLSHKEISTEIFEFFDFKNLNKEDFDNLKEWCNHTKKNIAFNSAQILFKCGIELNHSIAIKFGLVISDWERFRASFTQKDDGYLLELFNKFRVKARKNSNYNNLDSDDIDDSVQETFIRIWNKIDSDTEFINKQKGSVDDYISTVYKNILNEKTRLKNRGKVENFEVEYVDDSTLFSISNFYFEENYFEENNAFKTESNIESLLQILSKILNSQELSFIKLKYFNSLPDTTVANNLKMSFKDYKYFEMKTIKKIRTFYKNRENFNY